MNRHKNYHNSIATLYLIPTPIGNLEDITLRSLRILGEVDVLFAEDTRVTRKMLAHFNIRTRLESLHEHNEESMTSYVIDLLANGQNIGLVSDQGMPLISDPGFKLVKEVLTEGYNVVSLPGASALLAGLSMSGIDPYPFVFLGFLDSRAGKRQDQLKKLAYREETLVFYEAPHRIQKLMSDVEMIMPGREVAIVREISKNHEEIIRGMPGELSEIQDIKGEIVVVVEGYKDKGGKMSSEDLVGQVDRLAKEGMSRTEAMRKVSEITGVPKNLIYQEYLAKTKKQ